MRGVDQAAEDATARAPRFVLDGKAGEGVDAVADAQAQNVAVQRQFEPARHRRTVNGADHRLAHRRPFRRDIGQLRGVAEFLEVQSRAEHRIGSGEDHHIHIVIGFGVAQGREELLAQRTRQGIT